VQFRIFLGRKIIAGNGLRAVACPTGTIRKVGVAAKLALTFPSFPIQFIELSRRLATMRFVGRVLRRDLRGRIPTGPDSEHPWDGTLVRRPRVNCLST